MPAPDRPPLSELAATAVEVARERAAESRRAAPLFIDPLAVTVDAAYPSADGVGFGERVPVMAGYIAARTRLIDDEVLAAVRAGCAQVVLFASGLDARAGRLDWPAAVVVFELDLPEMVECRRAFATSDPVSPGAERRVVECDLRADWGVRLLAAGFDPSVATVWIAEGLLMYLTPADNDALVDRLVAMSAPGSRLVVEHVPSSGTRRDDGGEGHDIGDDGASWRSTHDDPVRWLSTFGWHARAIDVAAAMATLDRPVPPVLDASAVGAARARLVVARRRDGSRTS